MEPHHLLLRLQTSGMLLLSHLRLHLLQLLHLHLLQVLSRPRGGAPVHLLGLHIKSGTIVADRPIFVTLAHAFHDFLTQFPKLHTIGWMHSKDTKNKQISVRGFFYGEKEGSSLNEKDNEKPTVHCPLPT
jgi:hypothetical protein